MLIFPSLPIHYKLIWTPFLDPDYVRSLSLGAVWNFCEGLELPWLDLRVWAAKGLFYCLGVLGPKGLEPNYYSTLLCCFFTVIMVRKCASMLHYIHSACVIILFE